MLSGLKVPKEKLECGQEYCSVETNLDNCFSCGHPFCPAHYRQVCHDCVNLYNDNKSNNPSLKEKLNKKINNMEKDRNKKPQKK
jgi:hypothetical protein